MSLKTHKIGLKIVFQSNFMSLNPNFWTLADRLGYGMMATSPNVYLIFSHQTLIFGPEQIDCKKKILKKYVPKQQFQTPSSESQQP